MLKINQKSLTTEKINDQNSLVFWIFLNVKETTYVNSTTEGA